MLFILTGISFPKEPSSLRVAYLVAYLAAVTFSAAYSASFISYLTVQDIDLPFNSLRELVDTGTYKLGVLANSGQLNNFNVSSTNGQW